ncbi:MAG: heme exporter protein CcmB [Chloroflexota bacterium]
MTQFSRKVLALVWKDMLSEARTKDIFTSVFVFALLTVLIFSFALEPGSETTSLVAPGMLWVAFTFAGVLGFGRSFVLEKEHGCLDGLMLCPVEREVIYWGKAIGNLVFMLMVEVVVLPIFYLLLNLPLDSLPQVVLIVLLTTIGFVSVGTLFSALAANTRARDVMLPILFLPVVVPLVIAAVKSTGLILQGSPWADLWSWLQIILAFDVIFLVISSLVFPFVLEG